MLAFGLGSPPNCEFFEGPVLATALLASERRNGYLLPCNYGIDDSDFSAEYMSNFVLVRSSKLR